MMKQSQRLDEKLSFDQLFRMSDPQRAARSFKVRGPPLDIDSYKDAVYYIFNFKANPSTTGLRHKGYVKFLRPKNPKRTPLQKLDCIVDCTCPDYKFRWAWANKQRGASRVGPQSLNQAWNRAPRKTNPSGMPGLCKHVLACREYIYGLLSSFPGDEPDTADKLDKLTRYATKRWANYHQLVAQAKEREQELQRQIAARRRTGKAVPPEKEKITMEPPLPAAPVKPAAPAKPATPAKPAPKSGQIPFKPGQATAPIDQGERQYTIPNTGAAAPPNGGVPPTKGPGKKTPPPSPRRKREESQIDQNTNPLMERVVIPNAELPMTTLLEAKNIIQELADEAVDDINPTGGAPVGLEEPPMDMDAGGLGDGLEGSEPPISDTAIGADTEADTALGLLRQMRDLLAQLAAADAPAGAGGEEMPGEGAGALPGEEGGEFEMPPEPPADGETPSEEGPAAKFGSEEEEEGNGSEEEHAEGGSEREEEKEREERPNRRPSAD